MPILEEYSLAGQTAILSTAGGPDAPFLAQALAAAGAAVFAIARRQELLDPILDALGSGYGGTVSELDTPAAVAQALAAFDRQHSRVDILVNAGRSELYQPLLEITPEQWDAVQSRNLRAAFLLSQQVGRRMLDQQYGRVINIISGLAERGMVNAAAYAVSQAGLLALTRSLAVEWGPHNIRVNAIGTGWTTAADIPPEIQQQERLVRYIPLRRKGHPAELGPLLVYLCSPACDYTTGQPVYIDGGLNAHP